MENRRSRRKNAQEGIQVTNSLTAETIGYIGNLSVDGMLLMANRALPDTALGQVSVALPGHAAAPSRPFGQGFCRSSATPPCW